MNSKDDGVVPSRIVKTYRYNFGTGSYVEVEIEDKAIKSIDVYMKTRAKTLAYYGDDSFYIKNTKQFAELVKVFNKIVEDFYE